MTGSSAQKVSSTSMGWEGVSCCNVSLHAALDLLLALFLGFGGLAMFLTFTGTSLIPPAYGRGTHSTSLAFFALRFGTFITKEFRMENQRNGMRFFGFSYNGKRRVGLMFGEL
jgi:hypothetical protein